MIEEKKQRDHLLQLNQILAQQVMEKSKAVACKLNFVKTVFYKCMGGFICYFDFCFVFLFILLE